MTFEKYFEDDFLEYGWVPNWYQHPEQSPLEMVLIEPRDHPYLPKVLANMSALVPNAALTIVHSEENADTIRNTVYADGENHVRLVPVLPSNLTRDEYSSLMTTPELWSLFHSRKVLLFQLDSGLRYNNLLRFMQYDFIGAPWDWPLLDDERINVGNGGFSLRSTDWMLDICNRFSFDVGKHIAEDVFFAKHLVDCEDAILPSKQVASSFSVEHIPWPDPMAFHQAYEFHDEGKVVQWLTQQLAPPEMEAIVEIQDAWIECEDGLIVRTPDLVPWLEVGISTNGLLIDADTRLSCLSSHDPSPGVRKHLKIAYTRDGEYAHCDIRLNRMRVEEAVHL